MLSQVVELPLISYPSDVHSEPRIRAAVSSGELICSRCSSLVMGSSPSGRWEATKLSPLVTSTIPRHSAGLNRPSQHLGSTT